MGQVISTRFAVQWNISCEWGWVPLPAHCNSIKLIESFIAKFEEGMFNNVFENIFDFIMKM